MIRQLHVSYFHENGSLVPETSAKLENSKWSSWWNSRLFEENDFGSKESNIGGAWERQICTVRNVFVSPLSKHGIQLDDETLRTFIVEAKAIVNCRPLTVDTVNSPDMREILTSNRLLLTMKSTIILPLLVTSNVGICTQERYGTESSSSPTNSGMSGRRNICNCCS